MHIQRKWLLTVLRSRGNETTARHVELNLPTEIESERDRELLERCGINPNVLEAMAERDQELGADGDVNVRRTASQ